MSETKTIAPAAPRRRAFRAGLLAILTLLALALLGPVGLRIVWELVTGWWNFLLRLAPQITARAGQLPAIGLLLVVVLGGMHWFLGWLRRHQRAIADGGSEMPPWRFRWTAAIAGLITASTLMAMAGIGIIHQTGWMLTSNEPAWVYKGGGYSTVGVARLIGTAVDVEHGDKGFTTRPVPESIPDVGSVRREAGDYRVFALSNEGGDYAGLIVFRKPGTFGNDRAIVVMDGPDMVTFPPTELPTVIARYGHRMHLLQ